MSPLYDFACECGVVTEERQGYEVTSVPCRSCGHPAQRVSVYRHQYISGETVAKPGFTRPMYTEMSMELDYEHKRAEDEVGHELPSPNYYKHQMARAEGIDPNARATAMNRETRRRTDAKEKAQSSP